MTFEHFIAMKERWLKNLHLVWLIQGHLTQEDAMDIVRMAETSLGHQKVHKDDIDFSRMVCLRDRTVYQYENSNGNPTNPNSLCECRFAYRFDTNKDDQAVAMILVKFLEEPVFSTLRTKE